MATPSSALSEEVVLVVDGRAHTRWERYRIDSDLLTPADAWDLSLWASRSAGEDTLQPMRLLPDYVTAGAEVQLLLGGERVLRGRIDSVEETLDKSQHTVQMSGRDFGAALVDCSVPMLSLKNATLDQIIKSVVKPVAPSKIGSFGIDKVDYRAKLGAPRQTVHTEPGQTVWDWLLAACEANQVWPWFAPDGTLVIGSPDYSNETNPPAANLVLRAEDGAGSASGNNIKRLHRHKSIHSRYTHITVLAQSAGTGEEGHNALATVQDDDLLADYPSLYRPKTVLDGNAESQDLALRRANKLLADSRMAGERLHITVAGHRIRTADGSKGGLWQAGMRVRVLSEPHGVDDIYFVMKRTFEGGRQSGTQTELELVLDGTWLLNLAKVKGKRKSNTGKKNSKYVAPSGASTGVTP